MRIFFIYILLLIVYLSVRSTLLAHIPTPDLSLILVFYVASQKALIGGPILGFVLGYIEDVFSGGILGMTSLSLIIAYLAAYLLFARMRLESFLTIMIGVAAIALIKGMVSYLLLFLINPRISFLPPLLPSLLATMLLSVPIIKLISMIDVSFLPGKNKGAKRV